MFRLGVEDSNLGSRIQSLVTCASDETQAFGRLFDPCPVLVRIEQGCSGNVLVAELLPGQFQVCLVCPGLSDQMPNGVRVEPPLDTGLFSQAAEDIINSRFRYNIHTRVC